MMFLVVFGIGVLIGVSSAIFSVYVGKQIFFQGQTHKVGLFVLILIIKFFFLAGVMWSYRESPLELMVLIGGWFTSLIWGLMGAIRLIK